MMSQPETCRVSVDSSSLLIVQSFLGVSEISGRRRSCLWVPVRAEEVLGIGEGVRWLPSHGSPDPHPAWSVVSLIRRCSFCFRTWRGVYFRKTHCEGQLLDVSGMVF